MKSFILSLILFISSIAATSAHDIEINNLKIEHPYSFVTAPNARVAGGYITITNLNETADYLIGGSADFVERIEIHEMAMENDVMRMREIEGGIEIPAGGKAVLEPGGLHVMFIGLKEPLQEGMMYPVTLEFSNAGEVEVDFMIEARGENGSAHNHGDMKKQDHNHEHHNH